MRMDLNQLRARLPGRAELLPVFAVFSFFTFSWSLYRMFWYVPGWLEYLSIWKVLVIAAYVLMAALLEAAVMAGLVSLLSLAFPRRLFKDLFVLQGCALAALTGLGAVLIQRKINLVYRLEIWQMALYPAILLVMIIAFVLLMAWALQRFPLMSRLGAALAERMTIFAYLYAPLGLLGMLVVLVRNLLGVS
jgi:hypothetical protein